MSEMNGVRHTNEQDELEEMAQRDLQRLAAREPSIQVQESTPPSEQPFDQKVHDHLIKSIDQVTTDWIGELDHVRQNSKQVDAIQITQQVGQGQQIPQSAMQEVQVPASSGLHYVPWSEASQVSRTFAATSIPAGTLLTSARMTCDSLRSGLARIRSRIDSTPTRWSRRSTT